MTEPPGEPQGVFCKSSALHPVCFHLSLYFYLTSGLQVVAVLCLIKVVILQLRKQTDLLNLKGIGSPPPAPSPGKKLN